VQLAGAYTVCLISISIQTDIKLIHEPICYLQQTASRCLTATFLQPSFKANFIRLGLLFFIYLRRPKWTHFIVLVHDSSLSLRGLVV